VVNSGMWDPTDAKFDGKPLTIDSDLKANGVCHDQRSGRRGPIVKSGADIKDGESKTLLLSENVHKDSNPLGRPSSWLGPLQTSPFTTVGQDPVKNVDMKSFPEQRFGMVWTFQDDKPFAPDVDYMHPINRDADDFGDGEYGAARSRFARPASEHPEVFIAAFCGGNTREIRETIEFRVYQQLMTPNGKKAALADKPNELIEDLLPDTQSYMNPPLNESDY
jgi:hypothetical protein